MISKNMYKVLKQIPNSPKTTYYIELCDKKILDTELLYNTLENAFNYEYVMYYPRTENYFMITSPFCLTEAGQIAIQEYERMKSASTKSIWALIISALSLITSIIAIIFGVQ